jgi:heme/copper-type cytochrome/quinol oxidase subunit 3
VVSVIVHILELHNPGFSLQAGGYASIFIALEGTFTILLVITTIVLLGMANRARLGLFQENGVTVEAFGEYFGWFSAIALINFLALYVQPFFPIA